MYGSNVIAMLLPISSRSNGGVGVITFVFARCPRHIVFSLNEGPFCKQSSNEKGDKKRTLRNYANPEDLANLAPPSQIVEWWVISTFLGIAVWRPWVVAFCLLIHLTWNFYYWCTQFPYEFTYTQPIVITKNPFKSQNHDSQLHAAKSVRCVPFGLALSEVPVGSPRRQSPLRHRATSVS